MQGGSGGRAREWDRRLSREREGGAGSLGSPDPLDAFNASLKAPATGKPPLSAS